MKPIFFVCRGLGVLTLLFVSSAGTASLTHGQVFSNKARLAIFVLSQNIFGKYKMNTFVDYTAESKQVRHTTIVKKFGIEVLRSEKTFDLDSNGFDLVLTGAEYSWPLSWKPVAFSRMKGRVEPNAMRAQYGMPLIGLETNCESIMESPQASITIRLPWFVGIFNFSKESMIELNSRRQPS